MADAGKQASAPSGAEQQGTQLEYASGAGLVLRLFWMGFGNLLLLYLAGSIAREPMWSIGGLDVAFWFTVTALIAARYVDVARYEGQTVNSEPATLDHVRRYAAILFMLAAIIWAAAQAVKI